MDSAKWAGDDASANWVPGSQGMLATGKAGNTRPSAPHKSQCEPAGASPLANPPRPPSSALLAARLLSVQMPPNLPLRTSCASMDAGAASAEKTARKLRMTAKRAHKEGRTRMDGKQITA